MKQIWLLLLCGSLLACSGWHLRGTHSGVELGAISVALTGQQGSEYLFLEEWLKERGVLGTLESADLILELSDPVSTRREASRDANAVVTEYELSLMLTYRVLNSKGLLIRPKTEIRAVRRYDFNPNDIAASDHEAQLLRRELQYDLAVRLMQQLHLLHRTQQF